MSTCSAIATRLDEEMLLNRSVHIYPPYTPVGTMPPRSGSAVASELGGRYLLRYLLRTQYQHLTAATSQLRFVTHTNPVFAKGGGLVARTADADKTAFRTISRSKSHSRDTGPRRVRLGGGLEYVLPKGFPTDALVLSWPVPVV